MSMENRVCSKCHRQGCWTLEEEAEYFTDSPNPVVHRDWVCKCGHSVEAEPDEGEHTEGAPGSLLADMNEFGRLVNDLSVSMGGEPVCKPIRVKVKP